MGMRHLEWEDELIWFLAEAYFVLGHRGDNLTIGLAIVKPMIYPRNGNLPG